MNYTKSLNLPIKDFKIRSEDEILQFWQKLDIYSQLSQKNQGQPKHIFYDIPDVANKLDISQLVNIILRDILLKYKAMSGFDVYHIPTWDCYHPSIEHNILKDLNKQYDNIAPVRLRELCREYVFHKINIQKEQLQKMGVFGDWDNALHRKAKSSVNEVNIHNLRYEFKILNTLGKLLEAGFLRKKVQPEYWCIRCQTALNNEEIELRQYKSSAGYVKFPVCEGLEEFGEDVYFLVQVFDLWKLTASEAIAVFEGCEYAIVEVAGEVLIIQDECVPFGHRRQGLTVSDTLDKLGYPNYRILKRIKADTLTQFTCIHPLLGIKLPVVVNNIASERAGTGLFNVAPGYSLDDYKLSLKYKFSIISVIDDEGKLTNEAEQFCGFNVFDVDKYITLELEKRGYLALTFSHESLHPHCWTCSAPAVFRPVEQWFFSPTKKLSERAIAALNRINWISDSDRQQMQTDIENVADWTISRQRFWGVAIPAIHCEKCNYQVPIAKSIKALKTSISKKGVDAWFDTSTKDIICNRCGSNILKKEPNVLDSHFYSIINFITHLTSIWKSTNRKGHSHAKAGHSNLTIDISFGQTKCVEKWLQQFILTLNSIENRIPFITLHINHAQLHQTPTFLEENNILAQFSSGECCADVLRLWVVLSNGENNLKKLNAVYNDIKTTLYLMLRWLPKYDKSYDYLNIDALCPIDRLALNRLMKLISTVNSAYSNRDFMTAFNLISEFCQDELNDFYLKAVEDRLYSSTVWSSARWSAQTVLWKMANTLVKLIAPVTPFLAEQVWTNIQQRLRCETSWSDVNHVILNDSEEMEFSSVFLADWPVPIRMIQQGKYERDWKQLLWFKTELTQILTDARNRGLINDFKEADVVVYANVPDTTEILQNYVEDIRTACSIAKLQILQQEPENTQELLQASAHSQIFFDVRHSGSQ